VLSVLDGHGLSVGLISCNKDEMDIFHTATVAQIGNEKKNTDFWESSWLYGQPPKHIAIHLCFVLQEKKWNFILALQQHAWWIKLTRVEASLMTISMSFNCILWLLVAPVELREDLKDTISWRLTQDACYSAASAYRLQFIGGRALHTSKSFGSLGLLLNEVFCLALYLK
jgi:hypothetical protein